MSKETNDNERSELYQETIIIERGKIPLTIIKIIFVVAITSGTGLAIINATHVVALYIHQKKMMLGKDWALSIMDNKQITIPAGKDLQIKLAKTLTREQLVAALFLAANKIESLEQRIEEVKFAVTYGSDYTETK